MKRAATALLLAGGQSTRMGTDKALLPWGTSTLLAHVYAQIMPLFDEVLVAGGVPERCTALGLPSVPDAEGFAGPMAGVVAGLRASTHEACYVHACDMPVVDTTTIERLFAALTPDIDAAIVRSRSGLQPLCGVYRRGPALEAFAVQAATGSFALHRALAHMRMRSVEVESEPPNLNSPEDLATQHP